MGWVCTDPNTDQYGRKIGDRVYEFKENIRMDDGSVIVKQHEIDLNEYSDDEINDDLTPYGWSIEKLKEDTNIKTAEWLMAECIFEQSYY